MKFIIFWVGCLLSAIFIALKLYGLINWGWMWVLAPLWIPFVMACALPVLVFTILLLGSVALSIVLLLIGVSVMVLESFDRA